MLHKILSLILILSCASSFAETIFWQIGPSHNYNTDKTASFNILLEKTQKDYLVSVSNKDFLQTQILNYTADAVFYSEYSLGFLVSPWLGPGKSQKEVQEQYWKYWICFNHYDQPILFKKAFDGLSDFISPAQQQSFNSLPVPSPPLVFYTLLNKSDIWEGKQPLVSTPPIPLPPLTFDTHLNTPDISDEKQPLVSSPPIPLPPLTFNTYPSMPDVFDEKQPLVSLPPIPSLLPLIVDTYPNAPDTDKKQPVARAHSVSLFPLTFHINPNTQVYDLVKNPIGEDKIIQTIRFEDWLNNKENVINDNRDIFQDDTEQNTYSIVPGKTRFYCH